MRESKKLEKSTRLASICSLIGRVDAINQINSGVSFSSSALSLQTFVLSIAIVLINTKENKIGVKTKFFVEVRIN